MAAKAWKLGDPSAPSFPDDFEVVNKAVLQITDIKTNRNKYYAVEVHAGASGYRVFTHYGRTDDLDTNPDAGQKECRYFETLADAQRMYESIYREKTSAAKGYHEVSLASSRIGSTRARGTSSGQIDDATIKKAADAQKAQAQKEQDQNVAAQPESVPQEAAPVAPPQPPPAPATPAPWHKKLKKFFGGVLGGDGSAAPLAIPGAPVSMPIYTGDLHPRVVELVDYVYAEATSALTSTVAVKITAQGIETPLGVLTLGQIQKGEAILQELYGQFQKKRQKRDVMEQLSGDFYTMIPHRIGRTRAAIQAAVIDSMEAFEQKQETLQLMKDMLKVNGEGNVLYHSKTQSQFDALRCNLAWLDPSTQVHQEIRDYVLKSQIKSRSIKVLNVFQIGREPEVRAFAQHIDNQRLMFHGSRIRNWVGILSRGIVLPKIAVSLGINRTDAGWLGNGIYFGDAACTSSFYTSPGRKGTRLMALARVGLGRMKEYRKITYGLTAPPDGYDSCHGVRNTVANRSEFADDEYVVYNPNQQKLEYLVEFKM
jgi:predicted DNA-binding WGR domain protein